MTYNNEDNGNEVHANEGHRNEGGSHGREAGTSSSKENIDHEVSVRRTPDIPITEGLGNGGEHALGTPAYPSFGNGARAAEKPADPTRASDKAAGPASGVPEPVARQRHNGEGAMLAAAQTQGAPAHEAVRDRGENRDDEAKNDDEKCIDDEAGNGNEKNGNETSGNESDAAVANLSAERERITKAAIEEIAAFKKSPQDERHQYAGRFKLLQRRLPEQSGTDAERWQSLLAVHAGKRHSFGVERAAALWGKRREIWQMLTGLHQKRKAGEDISQQTQTVFEQIRLCLLEIEAIQSLDRMQMLAQNGAKTVPVVSKKKSLSQLPADWREQIVARAASSKKYGAAIAVLRLIGCRPIELKHGVKIRREGEAAVIRVQGAKVTEKAGQLWREYRVEMGRLPTSVQKALDSGQPQVTLQIASEAALRSRLKDFSHDLGFKVMVTPYAFRHALAVDMREDGWSSEQIGAVLGHAVAETSRHYGTKVRKRKGGNGGKPKVGFTPQDVKVPRPVRPRASFEAKQMRRKPRKGTR